MIKQIIVQSLNGFALRDIPFLIFQLCISAFLVFLIRVYWKKHQLGKDDLILLKYLIPLQIVLTTLAIFIHQSPWISIVFGLISIIPLLGSGELSQHSKIFYFFCVFVAFGCGAANLAVTLLVTLIFILPLIYFNRVKD